MRKLVDRAYVAISRLDEMGAAGPALGTLDNQERIKTIRAELHTARANLGDVRFWLNTPQPRGLDRVAEVLREFHEADARLHAALRPK